MLKWIKSFLQDRKQRVLIRGTHSEWAPVTSGVPQGSVLGPSLFLIFINDMPDLINSTMKLFADDSKMYRRISRNQTNRDLQVDLDKVCEWSDKWQMVLNQKKCKHMHIGTHENGERFSFKNENTTVELQLVEEQKDLGLLIDSKLKFSKHITQSVSKANRNLGLIARTFTYLDKDMFVQLYKSLVRPHLEYATPVWSPLLKKDRVAIENVQRRASRLLQVYANKEYQERLRSLGLPSLEYRRERADLVQVYKIFNGIRQNLTKKPCSKMSSEQRTRGQQPKTVQKKGQD